LTFSGSGASSRCAIWSRTSPIAKRPINTVTKSTPVRKNGTPKVKRSMPHWASVPIVPRNMPTQRDTRAVDSEAWPSTATLASPNTTTAKSSTVEKVSANVANGGAKKARNKALTRPPKAEDMMARPSAYCVCPWRLRRYPSQVAGTSIGSPGMLKRMPVIDPAKTPPQ
jgi:hypothetical protein